MFGKEDKSKRTYCGKTADELEQIAELIDGLEDDTVLAKEEIDALEIAYQSLYSHIDEMRTARKWDHV